MYYISTYNLDSQVQSRLSRCNISGGKRGSGQISVGVLQFSPLSIAPPLLHTRLMRYLIHVWNNCDNRIMSITVTFLWVLGNRSQYILYDTRINRKYTNNCEDTLFPFYVR